MSTTGAAMDLCRWLESLSLRPSCLLVAHAIGHAVNGAGSAFPSLRTLAERTGLSRRTVIRAVQELEREGVVTRESRWRKDGSRGSTIYSFDAGQWDLFCTRRDAGRRRGGGGDTVTPGGGDTVTPGSVTVAPAKRIYRDPLIEKKSRSSEPVNNRVDGHEHGRDREQDSLTIDVEKLMAEQGRLADRALALGYNGDLNHQRVCAWLREHAREQATATTEA